MSDATRRGVYHQQHKPPGARLHVTCKNCGDFFRNCLSREYIKLARDTHHNLAMTLGTDCGCKVTNDTKATWHNDCRAAALVRATTDAVQLRRLVSQSPPTTRTWAAARWHACVALDMQCHPGSPRGGNNMHHTPLPWVPGTPCAVQSYMDTHPPPAGGGSGQGGAADAATAPVLPAPLQATAAALPAAAAAAAAVAVTAPALAPTHAGGAGGGGGAGGAAGARAAAAAPGVATEEEPMFAMEDLKEAACALLVAAAGAEAVEANVLAAVEVTIGEPDEDHLLTKPADDAAMEELWRSFDDGDYDGMEDLEEVPYTADAAASAAAVDATFFMPVDSLMGDPDGDDLLSW